MERLEFIGYVGNDATKKDFDDNKFVINFSVAKDDSYKDKSGAKVERTKWFECQYWNQKKVQHAWLKKGTHVFVTGEVNAEAYLSKENEPKAKLVCIVDDIEILDRKDN